MPTIPSTAEAAATDALDESYPDYEAPDLLVVSEGSQLRALANDVRTTIIALLRERARSTQQLAHELRTPKGTVGHHLKVLERAGLIERGREAQWRPCRIAPGGLKGVDEWLERYRKYWEENFERLDGLLEELQAADHTNPKRKKSK